MSQPVAAAADAAAVEHETLSPAVFAELVRENQAMAFSIAYNSLRDAALAEEIAQDAFLQLYRNLHRLESREHVTRWLRRVVTHRCIDQARRRGVVREVSLDKVPEPSAEAEPEDPLLRDRMRGLLDSLPAKKRMLVILRYQEELEFEEIARILRIPVRTARTRLWRTLAHLREKAARFVEGSR